MNYEYGEVYKKYDMTGEITIGTGIVKVHDIFEPLPEFMYKADCVFVDPPWNKGLLTSFYTKAGIYKYPNSFEVFYKRMFECIKEIAPKTCYVEIGKEHLAEYILEMEKLFKHVTFYNSTYYHNKRNLGYIIHATNGKKKNHKLDGTDEEDIIKWVCENEEFDCIGDLCMGQGLVGYYAYMVGMPFVGTELNHKRLAVLLERINHEESN